jgi:hypothetical protein
MIPDVLVSGSFINSPLLLFIDPCSINHLRCSIAASNYERESQSSFPLALVLLNLWLPKRTKYINGWLGVDYWPSLLAFAEKPEATEESLTVAVNTFYPTRTTNETLSPCPSH